MATIRPASTSWSTRHSKQHRLSPINTNSRANGVDHGQHKLVKPTSTFHLFPRLPPEIRLLIWGMTMEEPRVVLISTPSRKPFSSPSPIPSALHICSESRVAALKIYAVGFSRKRHAKDVSPTWPGQIYFNVERDVLYFQDMGHDYYSCMWYHFGTCIPQEEQGMIRSICVDMGLLNRVYDKHWNGLRNLYVALTSSGLEMKKPLGLQPPGKKNAHAFTKSVFRLPWAARDVFGRRPVPFSKSLRHLIAQVKETLVLRRRQVAQTAEIHPVFVINV